MNQMKTANIQTAEDLKNFAGINRYDGNSPELLGIKKLSKSKGTYDYWSNAYNSFINEFINTANKSPEYKGKIKPHTLADAIGTAERVVSVTNAVVNEGKSLSTCFQNSGVDNPRERAFIAESLQNEESWKNALMPLSTLLSYIKGVIVPFDEDVIFPTLVQHETSGSVGSNRVRILSASDGGTARVQAFETASSGVAGIYDNTSVVDINYQEANKIVLKVTSAFVVKYAEIEQVLLSNNVTGQMISLFQQYVTAVQSAIYKQVESLFWLGFNTSSTNWSDRYGFATKYQYTAQTGINPIVIGPNATDPYYPSVTATGTWNTSNSGNNIYQTLLAMRQAMRSVHGKYVPSTLVVPQGIWEVANGQLISIGSAPLAVDAISRFQENNKANGLPEIKVISSTRANSIDVGSGSTVSNQSTAFMLDTDPRQMIFSVVRGLNASPAISYGLDLYQETNYILAGFVGKLGFSIVRATGLS